MNICMSMLIDHVHNQMGNVPYQVHGNRIKIFRLEIIIQNPIRLLVDGMIITYGTSISMDNFVKDVEHNISIDPEYSRFLLKELISDI